MRWSRERPAAPPPRRVPRCEVEFLEVGPDGSERWVAADDDYLVIAPDEPRAAHYLIGHAPGYDPTPPVPPAPPSTPVSPTALTCIRLNCDEQGRPTTEPRCPRCGHTTQLLRNSRWPRPTA